MFSAKRMLRLQLKAFGLDYRYLEDGHDMAKLVGLFEGVKDMDHPIVLHIHTIKGKGLAYAEANREAWHAGGPFHVEDGSPKGENRNPDTTVFDNLKELLDQNERAVVLNAGTPMGLGFVQGVREEYVKRGKNLSRCFIMRQIRRTIRWASVFYRRLQ